MNQTYNLVVKKHSNVEVIDSRDIAESMDLDHKELLKTIRRNMEYLAEGEVSPGEFFIPDCYYDKNNQKRPNFLVTKIGCDFLANKMIGSKGAIFTAAYVKAFEQMRNTLLGEMDLSPAKLLAAQAQVLVEIEARQDSLEAQQTALSEKVDNAMKVFSRPAADHWKHDMDKSIKDLCETQKLSVLATKGRMYDELERKMNCRIGFRLSRMRSRKIKCGSTKKEANALTKLDAISADKQLRVVFETVVREWQARSVQAAG